MSNHVWHVGIDVGGTFTDFAVVPNDGTSDPSLAITHKVASTPEDPSVAVERGLADLLASRIRAGDIARLTHGTTIGLNAVLQKKGAKVVLLTSRGHRDVMQIARARLPRSFDLHSPQPSPMVSRDDVYEIDLRFDPEGKTVTSLTEKGYCEALEEIRSSGAQAVAVSLVGGYAAEWEEQKLCKRLGDDLGIAVTSAAGVWPEAREYERSALAVLDAQIKPLMSSYLKSLEERIRGLGVWAPLFVAASNGGSVSLRAARSRPIQTVLSGPAAGVSAAAIQFPDLNMMTLDMGGTSSDIGILRDGKPVLTTASEVGEHPIVMPAVDVSAIGAGGGSTIATETIGSEPVLRVGPGSVGAVPGPVCYGMGGDEPALTDAFVAAGIIDPDLFLDGTFPLDASKSLESLAKVAAGLGRSVDSKLDAARGVVDDALRSATAGMAARLRTVMARHGQVPQQFAFVAFGGAGPTYAAILADEVGVQHVIVPATAATFCAFGAALTPVRRDFVRTVERSLSGEAVNDLNIAASRLAEEAIGWLQKQGEDEGHVTLSADIRYKGQPTTLPVELGSSAIKSSAFEGASISEENLLSSFEQEHFRYYGFSESKAVVQVRNLRVTVSGPDPIIAQSGVGVEFVPGESREIFIDGTLHNAVTATLLFESSPDGVQNLRGPAVVDKRDTTVLVPENWEVSLDEGGNLHLMSLDSPKSHFTKKGR